jgi:putative oxidoreductase
MRSIHHYIHRLNNPDLGRFFIRIALGAAFVHAGWLKVNDLEGVVNGFANNGIPAVFAYLVAYIEFLGGIAFIAGILVRYFGILTAVIMFVAMTKVHWDNGFGLANHGYEYVLVLMLASLAVVTLGSGKYSLAHILKK